ETLPTRVYPTFTYTDVSTRNNRCFSRFIDDRGGAPLPFAPVVPGGTRRLARPRGRAAEGHYGRKSFPEIITEGAGGTRRALQAQDRGGRAGGAAQAPHARRARGEA